MAWALRPDRAILSVEGPDAVAFLNGLISNDVKKAGPDRAVFASLLSAQGKWLHDLILTAPAPDRLWLDVEAERAEDLKRRLSLYKLRAKVTLTLAPELRVAVAWAGDLPIPGPTADGGLAVVDPRLSALGSRLYGPAPHGAGPAADLADWTRLRLRLGVPEGAPELAIERSILLENGYDELNAIDWGKGCYVGQELTARTKYRGLIRRRLVPIAYDGPAPAVGTPVLTADGKDAGECRGGVDGLGLAVLKLELLDREDLTADGRAVRPSRPDWTRFPAAAAEG